ncbi:MAG: TrmB family transcriptional regulator [Methanomassiliicoccales archaeon]
MDLLDIINMDNLNIEKELERIASRLRRIGLSDYESRAYLALVAMEHGSAEEVGETASIPRTSAYKVLQSLDEKGYVRSKGGRPTVYQPVEPSEIKAEIIREVSETFDCLSDLKGVLSDRGVPQLVYTISGKERVIDKIGEILESSDDSFIISTPAIRTIRQYHESSFRHAVDRGVEVTVLTEPFVKIPECTRAYRKNGLAATDVISDGKVALIAAPDLSLCGYSDNPFLAQHLRSFLEGVMERLDAK